MTTVGDQMYHMGGVPVNGEFTTGNVFFVDNATGSNSNPGTDKDNPVADLDYAIGLCSVSNGDIIYLMPGHAETLTAIIAADVIGVTVIGVGHGDARPTLTVNAAIYGLTISADDFKMSNVRIIAGASVTAASRLVAIAASDVTLANMRYEMAYDMYHMIVVGSGDNVQILDSEMIGAVTTSAGVRPQTCILNIAGTNVNVKRCYFNDMASKKAERWIAVVEGGKLTADMTVEDCTFICRGIATRTRTANASGEMSTLYCRGISPSSNTAVGGLFIATYQFILESYNVAAINKESTLSATTSDRRFKRSIAYL